MPNKSQESRADYHEGTVKLILEMVGEFVDEDTMKKIRLRAAGRAGGRARGRNYRNRRKDGVMSDDVEKRFDLGLKKADPLVLYDWKPAPSGDFCGRCVFYQTYNRQGLAGECLIIEGEIMQAGWCKLYADIEPKFNAGFAEMLERSEQDRVEFNENAASELASIARSKSGDEPAVDTQEFGLFVDFTKAMNDEEQTVTGIVLQPDIIDSQDDVISADEIKKSMYAFMEESQQIFTQHEEREPSVRIVENWLARKDMDLGGEKVSAGSWLMTVRVHDDALWDAVKAGKYTGFSIRGTAVREEVE